MFFGGRQSVSHTGACYDRECDPYESPCFQGIGLSSEEDRTHLFRNLRRAAKLEGKVTISELLVNRVLSELHITDTSFAENVKNRKTEHDVTALVESLVCVLHKQPVFCQMAMHLLEGDYYKTITYGNMRFPQICLKLVASIFVMESLLALSQRRREELVEHYQTKIDDQGMLPRVQNAKNLFINFKGESVLIGLNLLSELRNLKEELDREDPSDSDKIRKKMKEMRVVSDRAEAALVANIAEAVIGDMYYQRNPNALAGITLLKVPPGDIHGLDMHTSQEWVSLYTTWNGCFAWPFECCGGLLLFAKLLMPSISCASPREYFQARAQTLFWVVRSGQLNIYKKPRQTYFQIKTGPREKSLVEVFGNLNETVARRFMNLQGKRLRKNPWAHTAVLPQQLLKLLLLWSNQPHRTFWRLDNMYTTEKDATVEPTESRRKK